MKVLSAVLHFLEEVEVFALGAGADDCSVDSCASWIELPELVSFAFEKLPKIKPSIFLNFCPCFEVSYFCYDLKGD